MISQGLALTVIGMSVVLLFLILLILSMGLLAKGVRILEAYYPEKVEPAAPVTGQDQTDIVIAIAAASKFLQKI